jgi:hypothetical protein
MTHKPQYTRELASDVYFLPRRFDSSGNILEHYCDGDVVNVNTPTEREPQHPHSMYSWGPDVPLAFMTGKVEDVGKLFSTFIDSPVPPAAS